MNIQIGDMLKFNDKSVGEQGIGIIAEITENGNRTWIRVLWLKSVGFKSESEDIWFTKGDYKTFQKYWSKLS
jgi:hypothetical protein